MMAAGTAHLVAKNFRWRIESIVPEYSRGKRFRWGDRIDETIASGIARVFIVRWLREEPIDPEDDFTSLVERESYHDFELVVFYPYELKLEDLHDMALQDRHQIISLLRHPDNYVGYDSSNQTTDLGLCNRLLIDGPESEEVNEQTIGVRYVWRCTIREAE